MSPPTEHLLFQHDLTTPTGLRQLEFLGEKFERLFRRNSNFVGALAFFQKHFIDEALLEPSG